MINPLEPKSFGEAQKGDNEPETFRKVTRLSQHISYLKDFFRTYKDFTDAEIDTIDNRIVSGFQLIKIGKIVYIKSRIQLH